MPTLTDPDTDTDKNNRSAEASRQMFDLENRFNQPAIADQDRNTNGQDPLEKAYNEPAIDDSERNTAKIGEQEQSPKSDWDDKTSELNKKKSKGSFSNKKKAMIGLGIGGGAAALIAMALLLLPMKVSMFISNISSEADKIPGYAIENRVRYLITRTIAERALNLAKGNSIDSDLVFCKHGTIFCSLYKTYTTSFIEKKFDLKMTAGKGADRLKVTITPLDRTQLGGKAHSWQLDFTDFDSQPGSTDKKLSILVDNNKDMKNFLKEHVRQKIPEKSILGTIKRFISRKVLMRKYGVTRWSAFDKTKAKIADLKSAMRASIAKNVFGRVSDRLAIMVGCIDSPSACEKTLRKLDNGTEAAKNLLPDSELAKITDKTSEKELIEILMKSIGKTGAKIAVSVAAASTIIGTVLTVDTVMRISNALDGGLIDKAVDNVMAGAYVAYAYGDDTGVVTNAEGFLAGDVDLDTLGDISSMFDGAEASPLMAYENGISNTAIATLFGNNTAFAADSNVSSGQLVPDDMKIGHHMTDTFKSIPFVGSVLSIIGPVAGAWNKIVSPVIDFAYAVVLKPLMAALDVVGVTSFIESIAQSSIEFMLKLFGFIPDIGMGKPGTNNYIALSGGIRTESDESMLSGQTADGEVLGAGGAYLSTEQVAAIMDNTDSNQPKSSYLAELFSPNIKGSLTQQLALMAPSNSLSFINMLLNVPATIFSSIIPHSSAANPVSSSVAANPFDQALFGYPLNSPDLTADPETYTPEECTKLAKEREDSYGHRSGVSYEVYTKTDPCALEKTIVGSLLVDAGNMNDQYSLKNPVNEGTSSDNVSSPTASAPVTITDEDMKHITEDSTGIACAPGTIDDGTNTGYFNKVATPIRLCKLPNSTGAVVNSRVSGAFYSMFEQMKSDLNIDKIPTGSSFRTMEQQQSLYNSNMNKSPPLQTAFPGTSNHQGGMAIDFADNACPIISHSGSTCPSSKIYTWLKNNASKYHIMQFDMEWWHWSINGN